MLCRAATATSPNKTACTNFQDAMGVSDLLFSRWETQQHFDTLKR